MYFGFILHCLVGDGGGLYREFSDVCREKGKIAAYDHVIERVDEMGLEALESFLEELNEGELARSGVNSIGLGKRVLSRLIEAEEEGSLVKLLRCLHEGGFFRGEDAKDYGECIQDVARAAFCWNVAVAGTKPTENHNAHRSQLEELRGIHRHVMDRGDSGLRKRCPETEG